MAEPLLYTFEGLDGAGKTTNVERLRQSLEDAGHPTAALFCPSRSVLGKFIRANMGEFNPGLKEDLFLLDIRESIKEVPATAEVVLFDRYIDSIFTSNEEANQDALAEKTLRLPRPDRTFLLNLTPEESWEREGQVSDHPLDINWLRMKYERYEELVAADPERFQIVDATRSLDEVFDTLLSTVMIDLTQLERVDS